MSNSETSLPISNSHTSQEKLPLPAVSKSSQQDKSADNMLIDTSDPTEEEPSSKQRSIIPDIAIPSQETPTDIVGPSQLNPPPFSFVFTLKPAKYLKFAIEALSIPEHNQEGFVRINVDVNGFGLMVQSSGNNGAGRLYLSPPQYACTTPVKGKIVCIPELSQKLADIQDEDPLYVIHVDGSDKVVFFNFGTPTTTRGFSAELLKDNDEISKFHEISLFCEATVPFDHFRLMVQHLIQHGLLQVDIKDNTATLKVGSENSWKADFKMLGVTGSSGIEAGQSYRACFQWSNAEWLQKAIESEARLLVRFHTELPRCIKLRFILREQGYLEYVKELTA